ncbi:hypothetical protein HDU98_009358, partial [Podochytrium sp. JEL0797]
MRPMFRPQQVCQLLFGVAVCAMLFVMWTAGGSAAPAKHSAELSAVPAAPRPRVVVSLSTFSGRLLRLRAPLMSIAGQTLRPDAIVVSIPAHVARSNRTVSDETKAEETALLAALASELGDMLIIHTPATDYGPTTKLLGALERETDPNTIVITIDDDVIYHPRTVEALVNAQLKHLDGPICFVCEYFPKKWWFVKYQFWEGPCTGFLEGFAGVAYRVAFFESKRVYDFTAPGVPEKACRLHDDVWLSGTLMRDGIRPFVIRPGFQSDAESLPHTEFSINSVKNTEKEYRNP